MSNKRLSRKRLFNIEKEGQDVDIGISDAMKPALVSATQHREGYKVTTDMVFDFGASAAALKTQSIAVKDPIGPVGTDVSYLCKLTIATFGNINSIETVCLEQMSDGTMTDFDLLYGNAAGYLGSDAGGANSNLSSVASADIFAAVGKQLLCTGEIGATLADQHLYIVAGQASTKKGSTTIDLGNLHEDALDNIAHADWNGVILFSLANDDGTYVEFAVDNTQPWDDAAPNANKIQVGGTGAGASSDLTTANKLAFAISEAIHSHNTNNNWNTDDQTNAGGNGLASTTVTITHKKTGTTLTTENQTNYLTDLPHKPLGIVLNNFTGGPPHSITSGKLLIRVTGFIEPSDI